jgi:hypothetical protein
MIIEFSDIFLGMISAGIQTEYIKFVGYNVHVLRMANMHLYLVLRFVKCGVNVPLRICFYGIRKILRLPFFINSGSVC